MPRSRHSLWKQFNDACENDDVVKFVFDHLRNVGIASLMFAASVWHLMEGRGLQSILLGLIFGLVGVALYYALMRHFDFKIRKAKLPGSLT